MAWLFERLCPSAGESISTGLPTGQNMPHTKGNRQQHPMQRTELTALVVGTACLSASTCCRFRASRSRSGRRWRPKGNMKFWSGGGRGELACLPLPVAVAREERMEHEQEIEEIVIVVVEVVVRWEYCVVSCLWLYFGVAGKRGQDLHHLRFTTPNFVTSSLPPLPSLPPFPTHALYTHTHTTHSLPHDKRWTGTVMTTTSTGSSTPSTTGLSLPPSLCLPSRSSNVLSTMLGIETGLRRGMLWGFKKALMKGLARGSRREKR